MEVLLQGCVIWMCWTSFICNSCLLPSSRRLCKSMERKLCTSRWYPQRSASTEMKNWKSLAAGLEWWGLRQEGGSNPHQWHMSLVVCGCKEWCLFTLLPLHPDDKHSVITLTQVFRFQVCSEKPLKRIVIPGKISLPICTVPSVYVTSRWSLSKQLLASMLSTLAALFTTRV